MFSNIIERITWIVEFINNVWADKMIRINEITYIFTSEGLREDSVLFIAAGSCMGVIFTDREKKVQ